MGYRTKQEGAGLLTSEALSKNKSLFLCPALFDKWAWSHLIPFLVFSFHLHLPPFSLRCHHNNLLEVYWAVMSPAEAGSAVPELYLQGRGPVALPGQHWGAVGCRSLVCVDCSFVSSN